MKKIIAYLHTHWDREWYREFEEFRLRFIEVFDDILHKLNNGEIPQFYLDGQTSALEDYLDIFPDKINFVKQLIKDKKLFIGPFYCSADEFLVSGESLLKNLFIGLKTAKKFGNKDYIAYLSDTFGHSSYMSNILKATKIDKAVLWRGLGTLPADLNWNGIKTTYLIQGYFNDFLNADMPFEKKAELLKKYIDKIAEKSGDYILLPIGADHLKVCDNLTSIINRLNEVYKDEYEIIISNPFEYFNSITDGKRKVVSGEFLDNSKNFILQGVYSTRNDIKQANAICERKLIQAEMFDAINSTFFGKISRQKQIDYATKELIKNHAHDSIYGCSTDKVCREVLLRYEKVEEIADGILKRCVRDLSSDKGLSLVNLSNSNFDGLARIYTTKKLPAWCKAVILDKKCGFADEILYDTNKIPVTEDYTDIYEYAISLKDVPALSTKNLSKNNIQNSDDVFVTKNCIENKNLKIEIKNNKINVLDKKNRKLYKDFIKITDVADFGDSYNFAPIKNDKMIFAKIKAVKTQNKKILAFADVLLEIKIPEKSSAKRRSMISPKHLINLRMELGANSDFVQFKIKYNNLSKNHKLQLRFNYDENIVETVSEDLFGTVRRDFDVNYDINSKIPAPRGIELKTNTMPINRFVFSQGIGVITDGLHEIEIDKNALSVTLLRSTGIISNPINQTRGTPAGPPIECNEMQMLGQQEALVVLSFTNTPNNLYRICDYIFNPPILFFGNIQNCKFIENDNEKIKIVAIKKSDKQELIVRLVNYSSNKEVCNLSCNKMDLYETDLLEDKNIPTKNILYFEAGEIKTVKFV